MSYIQGYDPHTLREIVDVSQCRERLGELGDQRSLPALLERVWLLKVTGEFDEALAVSEQSVRVARMGGPRKDLLRARVLHATVLQAYANLEDQGMIRARPQSGFYVHQTPVLTAPTPDIARVERPTLDRPFTRFALTVSKARFALEPFVCRR